MDCQWQWQGMKEAVKGKGSESQINFPALIQIEEAQNMPDPRPGAQTGTAMNGSSGLFLEQPGDLCSSCS